jgi:hypothetical protein
MLSRTQDMLDLLGQVCTLAPIEGLNDSDADQLWWLTAAECALRKSREIDDDGKPAIGNVVGYFRFLVQGNKRKIPTLPDQDLAVERLRRSSVRRE